MNYYSYHNRLKELLRTENYLCIKIEKIVNIYDNRKLLGGEIK